MFRTPLIDKVISSIIFTILISVANICLVVHFEFDTNLLTHPTAGTLSQNRTIDLFARCKKVIATNRLATRPKALLSDVDISFMPFIVFAMDCIMLSRCRILNTSGGCEFFPVHYPTYSFNGCIGEDYNVWVLWH